AQVSTFSKTLYAAWSSLSHLNFGDEFFCRQGDDSLLIPSDNLPVFVNIVDQTLANRQWQKTDLLIHSTPCRKKHLLPRGLDVLDLRGFKLELPPGIERCLFFCFASDHLNLCIFHRKRCSHVNMKYSMPQPAMAPRDDLLSLIDGGEGDAAFTQVHM
ncbi:hypothetical protein HAX54_020354, partial [Datura stramonium]|nr:hypothetical protein [Datura stramonium]